MFSVATLIAWCYKKMSYIRIAVGICVQNTYSLPLGRLRKLFYFIFIFILHAWKITDLPAWNVQDVLSEYVIFEKKRRKNEGKNCSVFKINSSVVGNSVIVSMLVFHDCSVCLASLSHTVRVKQFTLISRPVPPVIDCSKACHPGHDRWLVDCSLAANLSLLYRPLSRVDWVPVSVQCVCGCDWSNGYRCHGWLKPSNFLPARQISLTGDWLICFKCNNAHVLKGHTYQGKVQVISQVGLLPMEKLIENWIKLEETVAKMLAHTNE